MFQEGEPCSAYAFNPLPDSSLYQNENFPDISSWGWDHNRTWSKEVGQVFCLFWVFRDYVKWNNSRRYRFISLLILNTGIKYTALIDGNSPDSVPCTFSRCAVQPLDRKYPQSHDLWCAEWGGLEQWTLLFFPHQHWRSVRKQHQRSLNQQKSDHDRGE